MNRFAFLKSIPLVIISCLVIVFLLVAFVVWPKYQEFSELQGRISSKQEELQYNEEYFQEIEEMKERLDEKAEQVSKIDSVLPEEKSLPALFDFVQNISSGSGMILKTLSPFSSSYSKEFPEIQETRFGIVLSGSYSSFKNFLSLLEKTSRMVEVESISFASNGEEPIAFNLRLKVYSY